MNLKRSLKRSVLVGAAVALALPLAACGSSDDSGGGTTITVLAAASLTSTFTELGKEFEAANDGVTVKFSFGGSSDLVSQIQNGAPADVFASADAANMDKVSADGTATDPKNFATNVLQIVTPPGNPAGIKDFADLGKPGVKVVICADGVPCGSATAAMELATKVDIKPVSEEQSVTDVLGKVESGDADAGMVYVTDVTAAGDKVAGVSFPESDQVVNTYPISVLKASKHADTATDFVDFVLSAAGQKVLADAGFGQP